MQFLSSSPAPLPAARPIVLAGLIASLAACGGGSGSTDTGGAGAGGGTPSQPALSLSGAVMIDQAVRNATVCVDLNGNGACDTGEPLAAATGSDGKFTLSYQPADAAATAAFNSASTIARITPESVDAAEPGSTAASQAFVLSAPAGKAAQINPLTTLVQKAVADGMTLAAAETAVAKQLGIDAAKIYDYQGDPASSSAVLPDTARTAAKITAYTIELGVPVQVTPSGAAATASGQLSLLNYTDAQNFVIRERQSDGVVQADGFVHQFETRAGKAGGTALSQESLFPSVTLTSSGWTRCDSTVPRLLTQGIPSHTLSCGRSSAVASILAKTLDVSGKSMTDVVTQLRAGDAMLDAQNIRHDRSIEMNPSALGNATFPQGAQVRTTVSVQLTRSPAYINNTATDRFSFTTLAAMIAARPASAVNLATPAAVRATTVGSAGPVDASHVLRVAFIDAGKAQFYACESTAPAYSDLGACVAHSQSSFTVSTMQGVQWLSFADFPGKRFTEGVDRGYTEYDGNVFGFRVPAPIANEAQAISYFSRLNGTASKAVKQTLGIE